MSSQIILIFQYITFYLLKQSINVLKLNFLLYLAMLANVLIFLTSRID